jgi:hypothetical protein
MVRFLFLAGVWLAAPLAAQPVSQSSKPLNNAEGTFRFAIMGDRTGGMLPGVFEKGAEKVNLMQPEFVLSVGDLVDGYTTDPAVWNAQWDEFDAIVDRLQMRFYYVPGNHDISNPQLDAVWRERHGSPWYSFRYKDVLFVSLHTEDRPGGGIGPQQLADITAALDANKDARWTLLFMHRPLWNYGNKAGYEQIETALGDRKYTLFSGHHHHYLYSRHNGRDHYVLATTGGGSHLRGVEFGEFEHITWVTMTDEGPQVAHLELDGIHDKNIVNDDNNRMIQALRLGRWMSAEPIQAPSRSVNSATLRVRLTNSEPDSMVVHGSLPAQQGFRFEPSTVRVTLAPNQSHDLVMNLVSDEPVDLHELTNHGAALTLSAMFRYQGRDYSLPATVPIRADWSHRFGDELMVTRPAYMHEDWDWKGPEDGRFSVKTTLDATHLHVDITAWDDRSILPSRERFSTHQDQFYVNLDANSPDERRNDIPERLYGTQMIGPEFHLQVRVAPGVRADRPLLETNDPSVRVSATSTYDPSAGRYDTRVSIPLSYITKTQGRDWNSIRLNVGWMDHDRPENTKPSILWLRPVWGKAEDWSGSFVISRP